MKILPTLIASLCFLVPGLHAQLPSPVSARDVSIEKIAPAFQNTPEFTTNIPNKRSDSLKWFEIEVEYDTKAELVDELSFVYTVFMNGKLFTGEVTYVNIPKGRGHYAVMYISPRSLDKITGGKPINQSMIENIEVEMKKSGMSLGKKSLAPKAMPNLPREAGYLLPKSDTPFQVLWWDRYEATKPTAR